MLSLYHCTWRRLRQCKCKVLTIVTIGLFRSPLSCLFREACVCKRAKIVPLYHLHIARRHAQPRSNCDLVYLTFPAFLTSLVSLYILILTSSVVVCSSHCQKPTLSFSSSSNKASASPAVHLPTKMKFTLAIAAIAAAVAVSAQSITDLPQCAVSLGLPSA